jgi:hypothetical protein
MIDINDAKSFAQTLPPTQNYPATTRRNNLQVTPFSSRAHCLIHVTLQVIDPQQIICGDDDLWHVAVVFPQVISTPIAGFLLDNFQAVGRAQNITNLDYPVIFVVAVIYFILGTVFVKQIKGVR